MLRNRSFGAGLWYKIAFLVRVCATKSQFQCGNAFRNCSLRLSFDAVLCCKIAVSMLDCVARSQFYCGIAVQNCSFSKGLRCEIAVSPRDCVSKLQSQAKVWCGIVL